MHTLGKVLMFFVIVGALGGTYLAARLLDTRAKWMAQVEERAQQYEENLQRVADARRRAIDRENEINRLQFANGRIWDSPDSGPLQGTSIGLGVGSNAGLGQTAAANNQTPYAHLFAVDDEGVSEYIGQFVLDQIDPDQAAATLNRAPYQGEVQEWPTGTYRVRSTIPAPWGEEFTTLWSQYGTVTQSLEAEAAMLRRQQEAYAAATAQLDERMQELQGHPDAPPEADVVEQLGIVEAMRLSEISRDLTLEQLDALRREYATKWNQLQDILAKNQTRLELLDEATASAERQELTPVSLTP